MAKWSLVSICPAKRGQSYPFWLIVLFQLEIGQLFDTLKFSRCQIILNDAEIDGLRILRQYSEEGDADALMREKTDGGKYEIEFNTSIEQKHRQYQKP